MNKSLSTALAAAALMAAGALPATAGTLENLERERAIALEIMLDPSLTPDARLGKLETSRTRLIDLERMALRDDDLKGRNTPTVRRAFANYDLTFLVHAATEKERALLDHWMEQLGLTTQNLLSGRVGRR